MSFLRLLLQSPIVVTPALGYLGWAMLNPRSKLYGLAYHRADPALGNQYALTFDDGPTEPYTAQVLDLLGELNAKATFFVIGRNVERFPRLVQRMHDEGHIVANHSLDHPHYGMLRGPIYWRRQIEVTDRLIEQVLGKRPQLFRPPMGAKTWFNCGPARRRGHSVITWSRRALDGVNTTTDLILERLTPTAAGDILVLHDGLEPGSTRDPSPTIRSIPILIQRLRDRGLEPGLLHQMLGLPAYAPVQAG